MYWQKDLIIVSEGCCHLNGTGLITHKLRYKINKDFTPSSVIHSYNKSTRMHEISHVTPLPHQ